MTRNRQASHTGGVSAANVSSAIEPRVNESCHTYTGGVNAGQKHILRSPRVVVICWGHNYATNSNDVNACVQLITDLVTGPFMNGLVQYGIHRGSVVGQVVIDTNQNNPAPATLNENDARTQLISWIKAGTVSTAPAVNEANLLYFLFPPTATTLTLTDGTTGFCGYHKHGKYNHDSQNDDLFWAIVSTTGSTPGTGTTFANSVAFCAGHELVEAISDRDEQGYSVATGGMTCEIGDLCETKVFFNYRGWQVEQYWSNWDSTCIQGSQPVSLRKFLNSINFDHSQGLRSLQTPAINLWYIASRQ